MVRFIAPLVGALLLSGLAGAAPARKRDSGIGTEVAVSAPNGIVTSATDSSTDTADAAQTTSFDDSDSSTDDSSDLSTVDPALIPTGDVTTGDGAVATDGSDGSDGVSVVTSTIDSESAAPTVISSSPSIVSSGSSGYGYNLPIYGSGSSSWIVSYNECVSQCIVSYPPPPTVITVGSSSYGGSISSGSISGGSISSGSLSSGSSISSGSDSSDSSLSSSDSSDSSDSSLSSSGSSDSSDSSASSVSGSGNTFNVIVAPHQGVLRFVPAYVSAQPGDTIHFQWNAGPHTVTQSSELTPCNGSIPGFASGMQNAGFTFDQTVNDTKPVFFYCGVPTHCQKGMFGAINPPTAPGSSNSTVGALMSTWAAADPDIMQALNDTNAMAANVTGDAATAATTWGNNVDVAKVDPSLHAALAKNILFTRRVMVSNPNMFKNGTFNPTGNVTIPADISALLDQADQGGSANAAATTSGSAAATGSGASSSASSTPTAAKTGAALSVRSSGLAVAAVAVVAAFFAL